MAVGYGLRVVELADTAITAITVEGHEDDLAAFADFLRLPFLDEDHPLALPQRQSVSSSQIGRLPKPCQTQNARLSCLHPGWRCRPGIAPVSLPSPLPSSFGELFGSWLRTIRPGIPPSEFVVANALRQTLPDFLLAPAKSDSLTKFITERQDTQNMQIFRLAS